MLGLLALAVSLAGGSGGSTVEILLWLAATAGAAVVALALGRRFGALAGGALTVAGLAMLLTNALPIAAGSVVLGEPVPPGVFGAVRIAAIAAVTLGAILLARPDRGPPAPIAQ